MGMGLKNKCASFLKDAEGLGESGVSNTSSSLSSSVSAGELNRLERVVSSTRGACLPECAE